MIPVSLTLKGIYSYQDKEQTIDFQNLTSAGLFGIFGSVGSGKSTILEAISFALYGETERLNRRDDRGYNMMNLKSDQLLIDFIFKNGAPDNQYRFIAKAKRNSKQFADVKTINREAFKNENNNWIPISADSAEEITGLNYLNFRRTVIIPQGRFQEFLQLGDTDRTKMMKELFHLEKFDLSFKTKLLEDKNNERLINIEGQLQQLTDVSDEKISEINIEFNEMKLQIEQLQLQIKEKQAIGENQKMLKELFQKIESEEKEQAILLNQKPEIEKITHQIKTYQDCIFKFKNQMDNISSMEKKSDALKNEIAQHKTNFQQISMKLEKSELNFEVLKNRFQSKEKLKNQIQDFEKILIIKEIETEISHLNERLKKGLKIQADSIIKIENLEKSASELKTKVNQLKENLPDITSLMEIKNWHFQLNKQKKDLENLEIEETKFKKNGELLKQELIKYSKKLGFETETIEQNLINQKISALKDELEIELETIEDDLKQINVKLELSRYSENLTEGESCPVCGSTQHPEKMEKKDLSEKSNHLIQKLNASKASLKELNQLEKEIANKIIEYQHNKVRLNEFVQKNTILKNEIQQHKESYQFKIQLSEEELEKEIVIANKQRNEINELEKELSKVEETSKAEIKNREKYLEGINLINNDLSSRNGNYQTLISQISENTANENLQLKTTELKEKIEKLNNEYHQLIKDYETTEKILNQLKPEKDKLYGIIETKEFDLKHHSNELELLNKNLDDEINHSNYKNRDVIRQIIDLKLDIESETKKIKDFENKLFSHAQQLGKLKKEAEGKCFDPVAYQQIMTEIQDLSNQLDERNKKLGSLEKELKELNIKLISKTKLAKEQHELTLRAENIKILKNLFKASGFVNYVSSVYLQNLINAANQRFMALTSQKLRLELTETNDFIIRDFLNEGKTRSVKTLSGGQTFQASLSLALALADNIQSVTKSEHNFFFLDEGFGSLDKESLSVVFASLKTLRKENRIVGVISHVEEMQQEIDNYLKIENEPETGSKIYKSWE